MNLEFKFSQTLGKLKKNIFMPLSPIFSLYFTLSFTIFVVYYIPLMLKTGRKPSCKLVKILRAKFLFIYTNEPTIWIICDLDTNISHYFSPTLFQIYNQFDNSIHKGQYHHPKPIRYSDFASIYNKHLLEFGYSYYNTIFSK